MPTIRKMQNKSGTFYEIAVSRGRKQSRVFTRWYVPDGWSQRAIDRELTKVAAEFERRVKDGEIVTHKEQQDFRSLPFSFI